MKLNKIFSLIIVLLLFVILTSCTNVTKINFDKIQNGMTLEQVKEILGEPSDVKTNLRNDEYYWFADARSIYEAVDKANEGKFCDYILVVFSVEFIDNKQVVLNKKMGNTQEIVEVDYELYEN